MMCEITYEVREAAACKNLLLSSSGSKVVLMFLINLFLVNFVSIVVWEVFEGGVTKENWDMVFAIYFCLSLVVLMINAHILRRLYEVYYNRLDPYDSDSSTSVYSEP